MNLKKFWPLWVACDWCERKAPTIELPDGWYLIGDTTSVLCCPDCYESEIPK